MGHYLISALIYAQVIFSNLCT